MCEIVICSLSHILLGAELLQTVEFCMAVALVCRASGYHYRLKMGPAVPYRAPSSWKKKKK